MKCTCPKCGEEINVTLPPATHQKKCPDCGLYTIIDLPSKNKRFCGSCHAEFDWKLKPKQKSVLIKGLVGE